MQQSEIDNYINKHKLDEFIDLNHKLEIGINTGVDLKTTEPFPPILDDLVRLHKFCLDRKVTTVLEFGCGYSTAIFAHAMSLNEELHGDYVRNNLRRNNAFEAHSVDDIQKFIDAAEKRIPQNLKKFVFMHRSPVHMTTFNGRVCTEYEELPNICPDLIYLDAPSQHSAEGIINGITTAHPDRLPMACDILKIEHFLLPGTLIVVDGRTANARFLKCNLQRSWAHEHRTDDDLHLFELQEQPLGELNERQIQFSLENGFLLK